MDESVLFNGVMHALFGGRHRHGHRALGHLTGLGSSLLSHPTALLTAAGVAWGIYETLQNDTSQGGSSSGAGSNPSGAGLNTNVGGQMPALPPLPAVGASVDAPMTDATRMVRLALSAAQADGALGLQERETVLAKAKDVGMGDLVERELQQQRPLAEIVAGVGDVGQRATLYSLAYAVIRADEQVGGAERIYLAQLANLLGLDPATVQQLESSTGAKIDATTPAAPRG